MNDEKEYVPTSNYEQLIEAIEEVKPSMLGKLTEYFENFHENYKKFIRERFSVQLEEELRNDLELFIPYRNEVIKIVYLLSRYNLDVKVGKIIHRFFESIIPFNNQPEGYTSSNNMVLDNFIFISHELFLYAIAIFIRFERFEQANLLLSRKYLVPKSTDYPPDSLVPFTVFRKHMESFNSIAKNQNSNPLVIRAQLLRDRNQNTVIDFKYLMQADFILFLRDQILGGRTQTGWYPYTLFFATDLSHKPFELFIRSETKEYFEEFKCLLGIKYFHELEKYIDNYNQGDTIIPQWNSEVINIPVLMNFEKLLKNHKQNVTTDLF